MSLSHLRIFSPPAWESLLVQILQHLQETFSRVVSLLAGPYITYTGKSADIACQLGLTGLLFITHRKKKYVFQYPDIYENHLPKTSLE